MSKQRDIGKILLVIGSAGSVWLNSGMAGAAVGTIPDDGSIPKYEIGAVRRAIQETRRAVSDNLNSGNAEALIRLAGDDGWNSHSSHSWTSK